MRFLAARGEIAAVRAAARVTVLSAAGARAVCRSSAAGCALEGPFSPACVCWVGDNEKQRNIEITAQAAASLEFAAFMQERRLRACSKEKRSTTGR